MALPLINGRIETILEKPSFKDSVVRRRCVIPASGYYEWQVKLADGTKQPFYIQRRRRRHVCSSWALRVVARSVEGSQ